LEHVRKQKALDLLEKSSLPETENKKLAIFFLPNYSIGQISSQDQKIPATVSQVAPA